PQYINYNFLSENSKWQLSLNQDSLTLATYEYKQYEEFKDKFIKVIDIFEEVYNPSFYIRLGLRYKDLILRSKLKIEDKPWSELISPQIASELHSSEFAGSILTIVKNLEIELEKGRVNFNHGLVIAQEASTPNFQETGYLFDADFFAEGKIKKEEIWNVFDTYNQTGGKLFRWSITDELHNAMEPQPITND
ncbi:MAG: TIGR04255 family protein, partial [Planktothrix sp.]|uniref:TIGR04255 family protein n=1 Tax=Planktothrix sp. TaxID=3088171 RepID=UPI0038D3BF6B